MLFISQLLSKVTDPENLFLAGRQIGKYIWMKRREPILKMGASFQISAELLLKNEIMPSFEKIGKVEYVISGSTVFLTLREVEL